MPGVLALDGSSQAIDHPSELPALPPNQVGVGELGDVDGIDAGAVGLSAARKLVRPLVLLGCPQTLALKVPQGLMRGRNKRGRGDEKRRI